jgi:phosphohistidine swiveling domain-containing protein
MGWSIVAPLLEWFIAYPQTAARYLGGGAPLRLYRGWPYFNVSIFRHLAFKAPGLSPPRFLLEFFPPDEEKRWLLRHAAPPDFRVYASVLSETLRERRWRRFRWNPFTNHRAWDALRNQLDREIATLEDPQGVAREQAERCLEWMREYVKVHIISLLYANILYQWGHASLPVDLREDLLRSPEGSVTHRVNRALFDLGQGAPLAPFLAQYGHRGFTGSWDVFAPRWAEEPDRLARLVENYGGGGRSDPAALVEAQSQAADAAMQALRQRAKGISGSLSIVHVRLLRRYLDLREEQRFHFDRLLFALKKALLRMGTDLLKDSAERVRWLQWPELRDLSEGRLSVDEALEIIGRREARWKSYGVEPPPDFLVGDEGVDEPSSGRWLQGLGISSGRVTGPARVIHTPEEASRLQPGDILVARATDPGWTSLFLVAGGVVLELGSLLSHGAVVAREYRLPAVANLSGATRLLRDGQWLTIDGDTGRVWVHEEP